MPPVLLKTVGPWLQDHPEFLESGMLVGFQPTPEVMIDLGSQVRKVNDLRGFILIDVAAGIASRGHFGRRKKIVRKFRVTEKLWNGGSPAVLTSCLIPLLRRDKGRGGRFRTPVYLEAETA
jgi:hypothetical protein